MRRSRKRLIVKVVICIVLFAGLGVGGYKLFNGKVNTFKDTIASLKEKLSEYELETTRVVCATRGIMPGERIADDMFTVKEVPKIIVPPDAFTAIDDISGFFRINVCEGACVTAGMLSDSIPDPDERIAEYTCIETGAAVNAGSCVDVRILFPDGSDYIVLAKKIIHGFAEDAGRTLLHCGEEEILLMDSALVDAFLFEGTKIYTTEYVERSLQPAATVTYAPSEQTAELIKSDPNIVEIATEYLNDIRRQELEGRLNGHEED